MEKFPRFLKPNRVEDELPEQRFALAKARLRREITDFLVFRKNIDERFDTNVVKRFTRLNDEEMKKITTDLMKELKRLGYNSQLLTGGVLYIYIGDKKPSFLTLGEEF